MEVAPTALKRRTMSILWPAFLMAAVLDGLVFAVVDPADLHWFGGPAIGWPAQAIYSITFLIFWGAMSVAGVMSALLWIEAEASRPADSAVPDRQPG